MQLGGTGKAEWYTPAPLIVRVRAALGGAIDFDPASCEFAQRTVQARAYLTAADDALSPATRWRGPALFVNPPYEARTVRRFAERLIAELAAGRVKRAVWLSNANTGAVAGQLILRAARRVCFHRGRIAFVDGDTGRPQANHRQDSMIAGLGDVDDQAFDAAFGRLGVILPGRGEIPAIQPVLAAFGENRRRSA